MQAQRVARSLFLLALPWSSPAVVVALADSRFQGGEGGLLSGSALRRGPSALPAAAVALGVLLAEYLLVSIRFDTEPLIARGGLWGAFGYAGRAGLVALLTGIATWLLGHRLGVIRTVEPRLRPSWLALHGASFAGFWLLTELVLGQDEPPAGSPALWLSLWLGLCLSSLGALILGLFRLTRTHVNALAGALVLAAPAGLLAWAVGEHSKWLWQPLGRATLSATTFALHAFSSDVTADAQTRVLHFESFRVRIADECSGFEGMGLAAVLLPVYLFAFRRELRFPNAWLLLPLGVGAMWLGNVVRLVLLMLIGARLSPALAEGGFHSKAGWVAFCAIALGLGALSRRLAFFSRHQPADGGMYENPSAAYLLPLLTLLATSLVTGLFATEIDRAYGLRIASSGLVLLVYRRFYRELDWRGSPAAALVGLAVGLLWLTIPGPHARAAATPLAQDVTLAWIFLRALGAISVVPLCEELAFRGYLLRWLINRDFTSVSPRRFAPFALLASSLAFGVLHERWLVASLSGVVFALLQLWRGRIGDALAAHTVANATIAAWVVVSGDYSHW
jgi:exosortase E/protease (VPEID-CTERM system)